MAGTYSTIEHAWWKDGAVAEMPLAARFLFVWSFTSSPMASLTGMSVVSTRALRRLLWPGESRTEDDLAVEIDALAAKPLVLYDWDHEVLWCVRRAGHALKNEKQAKGAARWLLSVPPESPILGTFFEHYPSVKPLYEAIAGGSA